MTGAALIALGVAILVIGIEDAPAILVSVIMIFIGASII